MLVDFPASRPAAGRTDPAASWADTEVDFRDAEMARIADMEYSVEASPVQSNAGVYSFICSSFARRFLQWDLYAE